MRVPAKRQKSRLPVLTRLTKGAAYGAASGGALMIAGYVRRSLGWGSAPQTSIGFAVFMGITMGAIAGAVMAALEPLRRRGLFGHYAAWIIACTCASVVFVGVLTLQDWRETFPFALFVGFCGGLAMGAVSRQLSARNSPAK